MNESHYYTRGEKSVSNECPAELILQCILFSSSFVYVHVVNEGHMRRKDMYIKVNKSHEHVNSHKNAHTLSNIQRNSHLYVSEKLTHTNE